jgi:flagellar biosynthetic protein FliQ
MTIQMALDIAQKTLVTTLLVSGPIFVAAIVIGIAVSLFQSMTQINEMTLVFVPKIVIVLLTTLIFLPWIVDVMTRFTRELLFFVPRTMGGVFFVTM